MNAKFRSEYNHMARLLFLWLFSCHSPSLPAEVTIYPEDQQIKLTGMLKLIDAHGPPGYGMMRATKSQDLKIRYWALELPVAVTVPCKPSKPEFAESECGSTRTVRLFFQRGDKMSQESQARIFIGHEVTVSGKLHRRTMMSEITPIFMDEINFSLVK